MYDMYAHMHDVSQKTLRELPAVGTQDTMTFYKWEWPGSNKKARNLAQILASWLEGWKGGECVFQSQSLYLLLC